MSVEERAPIRVLPERVANQIAAGEVVERPVAAVKELVENSLDAGATAITVQIKDGGRSYISVEDDGWGMRADDALLALERHATSKIRDVRDLEAVTSFGFRGEALPSLASVSRFTLRTRRADEPGGTELRVHGGRLLERKACARAPGTTVEVARLFDPVPARRKFLKSAQTEGAHIIELMRQLALAHPSVGFRLIEERRTVLATRPCPGERERLIELWGRDEVDALQPVAARAEGLQLRGWVSPAGAGRASRQDILFFVNRRPVFSRNLSSAVYEAAQGRVPRGRYPRLVLFVEIDPAAVDVNVHPAKREVRFRREGEVRRALIEALWEAWGVDSPAGEERPTASESLVASPAPPPSLRPYRASPASFEPTGPSGYEAAEPRVPSELPPASLAREAWGRPTATNPEEPKPGAWRWLGMLHQRYGLFETTAGLVLLDPARARARLRFDQVLADLDGVAQQTLLVPIPFVWEAPQAAVVAEHRGWLAAQGLCLEPFGQRVDRLETIPSWLTPEEAEALIPDLVDRLREGSLSPEAGESARSELARLVAARSMGSERPVSPESWQRLARDLLSSPHPLTDPEGRPTLFEVTLGQLRGHFEPTFKAERG